MSVQLPQPGVEIIQEFQAASPSIITPTLIPNIVGVAKQVVGLNVSDGAGGQILNPDALIQLPAQFTALAAAGDPAVYGGLNGLFLAFNVNNGPTITVTFVDVASGLTPASVVAQVLAALATAGVTTVTAETVGTAQWQLRTIGVGDFQNIVIASTTSAGVLSAFGIGLGRTYRGISAYNQLVVEIPPPSFPDPRGNLEELAIESSSIRVFQSLGGTGIRESLRTQSFLRNGEVHDAAVITGNVSLAGLTLPGDIATGTLTIVINGGSPQTVTFANPANPAAILSQINGQITGATATQSGNFLRLTTTGTAGFGSASSVAVTGGSVAATLGVNGLTDTGESIAAVDDGDGDSLTSLIRFALENWTTAASAAVVTASTTSGFPANGTTLVLSDGQQNQTVVFQSAVNIAAIIAQINAVVGTAAGGRITASDGGAGALRLTHSLTGTDSVIKIVGGTALATLDGGGTPTLVVGTYRGNPNVPFVGDELWIDGEFYANVAQVTPGAVVTDLRIDRLVPVSANVGRTFYLVAKGLPTSNRPTADLVIDSAGRVVLKQEQLRDVSGNPTTVTAPIYLSYTAVRKDVTAVAAQPGLLVFDDTTQLETALSPVDATNPLALGLFFAMLNAPGIQVTGLGVDEISADAPYGTLDAFSRAASFLEGKEVYAIAPLTHDVSVHQIFSTHVTVMSGPTNKGERVAIVNQARPTTRADTLVASGSGDRISGTIFDTNISNLTALVLNAGISPIGTIPADEGLFLDIATDSKKYSIASISGDQVTIRTSFSPGENDDNYYATTNLPAGLIQEPFTVAVRGASLTVAGLPDLDGIAETVAGVGRGYGNRRLWMTFPDQVAATVNGLETLLPGFYASAAIAGMVGQNPPQQSFTRFPITGFTKVKGSNDTFNSRQLNIMAGGGAWIIIQEAQGAPLISRFAITTDGTSIEVRTDSITKIVDFVAKFLRRSLLNYIGRFNITQGFLDSLGQVIDGLGLFLIESGVLLGFNLNQIQQDTDAPDTVIIDVGLDVPYPCNFIRLTLVI
jgi:hypothetical protein